MEWRLKQWRRTDVRDTASRKTRVLIVGQTPPPIGGQAIAIRTLLDDPLLGVDLFHVRMSFSKTMREMGRVRLRKLVHLVGVIARIYYHRLVHDTRILYYPPAGPERVPMLRDLAVLLSTRWLFHRVILHFHAGGISELYPQLSPPLRTLFRLAYYDADAAIRTTELAPDDPGSLQARREYVIPYGVDDAAAAGPMVVAERSEVRVLFAAVLRESKGLFVFLEACADLRRRGLPVVAELMGQFQGRAVESRARDLVKALGIEQHVAFLGVMSGREKHEVFSRADIFCLPTFFESESFPLAIVDAMSFGLPVVATRWRGIPAMVDDGRSGFLVEPHDAECVAERLSRLITDSDLRLRMAAAGRAKFAREYRSDTYRRRMAAMFREVATEVVDLAGESTGCGRGAGVDPPGAVGSTRRGASVGRTAEITARPSG